MGQPSGVYHEVYTGLNGSSLQALTNQDSNFPDHPDLPPDILPYVFETPVNLGNHYGQRLRALLVPPITGTYVFWLAADQSGSLFLSSDESPFDKGQIAYLTNSVVYDVWYSRPTQQSTNVYLVAGRRYYIEALHVSYNGTTDFVSVGWKVPDGTLEQPIPAFRLAPFGMPAISPPALTRQPASLSVVENSPAIFGVGVSNLDVVSYQWQRNGTNLPGVLGGTCIIPLASTNDNGASFHCVVSNSFGPLTSADAVLTVTPDTTAPALFTVANLTFNTVQVLFTEPVEPASATNIANFAINNGVTISAATLGASPRAVNLTTSPLLTGSNYTLTVSNVRDQAAARNTITPNSQQSFIVLLKGIYRELFTGIPGNELFSLTNNAAFPNSPTSARLIPDLFEASNNNLDNYGERLRSRIIPPITGNYTFWLAAHATATLLLGTNESPASARTIASVTSATPVSSRQWDIQASQKSALIPLIAGQQYYIEALMKEGVSVSSPLDHLSARWQLPDGSLEEPIPAARLTPYGLNPPIIAAQPANTTIVEHGTATFAVAVSNLDSLNFQWQRNGANIIAATNAVYTTPLLQLADSGSTFQCLLWNAVGMTNTASVLLTVSPDVTPPAIGKVLNSSSNRVVVFFSEPVEAASATNVANYSIPTVTISAAVLNNNLAVTLTTTPLATATAYTLTVNSVRDTAATPNTIATNSQWTFLAGDFFPQDIGSPPLSGSISSGGNGVDVVASGSGSAGTNDQFNFSYQQRRGDFDVKVRLQRLDFVDPWTVAGLMAREDLSTNSRFASVLGTPSIAGTFFQSRTNAGVPSQISGSFPVNYPYTWLRLQRVGGTRFTGFASYDGQTWTQLGTATLPLPATIYLGFAVASQNPAQTTVAQFRDFSDVSGGTVGSLAVPIEPLGPSTRNSGLTFTEIMYHPAPRADGRNLEFIELFNSNPFFEDISGYRIGGDVDYTFPPGTILQGGAFLVIAHNPADIQAVYGISNVTGPYNKHLSKGAGNVSLFNPIGAIFLNVSYVNTFPWPLAADGAGHSLVLARASYGEGDVRAWSQSDSFGGSPGRGDGISWDPLRNVVINEFLANSALPDVDYIELYNHSTMPVDLSGCWLSDTPAFQKFRIPDGTVIGPTGFVYFAEADFNSTPGTSNSFALNSGGETIYLVNSNQTRVVDAVLFEGQEQGVSTGRVPDGATAWRRLAGKTPGAPNGPAHARSIVINELMYSSITGDDNDQYIELYNRSTNTVNLGNWQFSSGITFRFPTNTLLAPNGYLVVAKDAAQLLPKYSNLNPNNTLGNFGGKLHGGKRIALSMPAYNVKTNLGGLVTTNILYVPVDEVTFEKGGRWGTWSDGGGSSLELMDPDSDNRLAPNWADSDETAKGVWSTITYTGLLDNANTRAGGLWNALQVMLLEGPAECLVDNVSVIIAGGTNLVANRSFESGLDGWVFQGDHYNSTWANSGDASSHSLHVVASDRGEETANYIFTLLTSSYTTGVTGTITARVKWLRGWPEILFRLRGGHLEAAGPLTVPANLGTPGARNSRFVTNAGPAITAVVHSPVAPLANQPVVVTARVHDPDGIASVQLVYRVDPFGQPITAPMFDDGTGGDAVPGDGVYSATIPGQPTDTQVAFYIRAADFFAQPATTTFPSDAPTRECLVRFGDPQPILTYGTYRMWLTQTTLDKWLTEGDQSNDSYDVTFAYGNSRVIYNAAAHYGSSPAHRQFFDSPVGTNCSYKLILPRDELFLGDNGGRIEQPGNGGLDPSCLLEQIAYRVGDQLGLPYNYFRAMNFFINGVHRGICMADVTRESHGWDTTWYPNSDPGDLFKIGYWYDFEDDGKHYHDIAPSLLPVLTTNLVTHQAIKKLDPYRMWFRKRAVQDSANNYTNLFNLVDAVNTTATGDAYVAQVAPVIDFTEWARCWATERIDNNMDLYGNLQIYKGNKLGAQNAYIFKPAGDSWKFLLWDVQLSFAGTPVDPLFNFTDPPMSNLFSQPLMLRTYWQALEDAANGPLVPGNLFPWIDARHNAFQLAGIKTTSPDHFKNFLSVRRDYILSLLDGVRADIAITSNGGSDFTNATTLATLSGTAPISARTITFNGVAYPLSWSSITNWSIQLPLTGQTNQFVFQAFDARGNSISNATKSITIYFNGPVSRPEDSLVINEIMYNPAVSNASYVEIYNRSTNTTISLANYRLQGVAFDFPAGALINPLSFILVVEDPAAFQAAYGVNTRIVGTFGGNLDPAGEALTLIKRGLTTNDADVIIDKVKYEAAAPWPAQPALPNSGAALQLIDAAQDNARVSNWDDGSGWRFFSLTAQPGGTRLYLYLDGKGDVYIDDIRIVLGNVPAIGSNYVRNSDFEAPLNSVWSFLGSSGATTSVSTNTFAHSGSNSLHLIFSKAGSTSTCLYQDITSINTSSSYTLSFWYRSTTNANNLTVRVGGSSFSPVVNMHPLLATPGMPNSVAGTVTPYPLIWINEVQPNNFSGLQDNTGTPQPWLELFNNGSNTLTLDGYFLSKSYTNLNQWAFPTGTVILPGQFRIFFADGQPQLTTGAVLHTSFRLDPTNGSLVLSRGQQILDYINYANMTPDLSYGSWPDGQLFDRQVFYFVSPGAANNPAPVPVAINEWMASNSKTLLNPVTSAYDDWFELYNFGSATINLSGYFLTHNLTSQKKWSVIPNGVSIAPHSFLLCWAENGLNGTYFNGNALHTTFNLSKSGDQIGLFSPGGVPVDQIVFGLQTSDVSQGRYPDGNVGGVYYFMPTPTPQTNNIITNNIYAPVLASIPNYTINEGASLIFSAHATDADLPAQTLGYSLLPGSPEGATINPLTGSFGWTPSESQGGAAYPITVKVTDNGGPPLNDTKTFTITVNEVNSPPSIGSMANITVNPGTNLSIVIPVTDPDVPAQTLSCALLSGPAGASVDPIGLFNWTPSQAQASSTNLVVITVMDNGAPPLSATQSFTIFVTVGNPCGGFKGDVSPRPGGNGSLTISDWVQIGRFAAGLADITNACELIKADCAPKPCGNGVVTISDWVQAGRYAAGLDPIVSISDCGSAGAPKLTNGSSGAADRTLTISNMVVAHGQTNCLQIFLNSQGNENGLGWSIGFDPTLLTFVSLSVDNYATNAAIIFPNTNGVSEGRLGLAFLLSLDDTFPAGLQAVADVCFRAADGVDAISTSVTMEDQPVIRDVSDAEGMSLFTTYQNGTVNIAAGLSFQAITVMGGGQVKLTLAGPPGGICDLQGSPDLVHWESIASITNTTGKIDYLDTPTNPMNPRFYRVVQP